MIFFSDNMGGGSGGGPEKTVNSQNVDGLYSVTANQIEFFTGPPLPPAIPGPSVIRLLSAGMGIDGQVYVRGTKGVRVTAGPPPLLETASDSTNGVEIMIGELGKFTLQRGLLPVDQKMEMTQSAVSINAGAGKVTIESLTEITLSVAGGVSKIKLGPDGITIEGLMVTVKGDVQTQIQGTMTQVKGDAMTQISGGVTMIG
jgi:hypothetical protein